MKLITLETRSISVNHRGDWLHVVLHTDNGLQGIGEASHGGFGASRDAIVEQILVRQIQPILMECDLRHVTETIRRLKSIVDGLPSATAVSACEQALWDLAGRVAGMSVAQMFGNASMEPVPLYANINRSVIDRTPHGFAANAIQAQEDGFSAIKLAPFDGILQKDIRLPEQRQKVRLGVDCVAAVCDAVGHSVNVMVDCHSAFDLGTADMVACELAACGVTWFEEPLPLNDIASYVALRSSVSRMGMELVGGELLFDLTGFYPWMSAGAFDVIMPDVKHCGGIAALRTIGELANARGIAIAPHNPSGPVATVASAHSLAGIGWYRPLEIAWGEVPWRSRIILPHEIVEHGHLHLPKGNGLRISDFVDASNEPGVENSCD
ncbi:MAG: mandelate racemase/muconate lactonizing enzyme family protein [Thermomicrobiales bacterium]